MEKFIYFASIFKLDIASDLEKNACFYLKLPVAFESVTGLKTASTRDIGIRSMDNKYVFFLIFILKLEFSSTTSVRYQNHH